MHIKTILFAYVGLSLLSVKAKLGIAYPHVLKYPLCSSKHI